MRQATAEAEELVAGEAAVNETEEEKTEEAVENQRKSGAADVKAVEALNKTLEAVNMNDELSHGPLALIVIRT